jgi:hypothetical protein
MNNLRGFDVAGGIEDGTVDGREPLDRIEGFLAAISGDDVELRGFDHQFAGGDVGGKLTVDDEETRPCHGSLIPAAGAGWFAVGSTGLSTRTNP